MNENALGGFLISKELTQPLLEKLKEKAMLWKAAGLSMSAEDGEEVTELLEAIRIIKWHFILGGYNPPDFRQKPYCGYKESDFIRWAENILESKYEEKSLQAKIHTLLM